MRVKFILIYYSIRGAENAMKSAPNHLRVPLPERKLNAVEIYSVIISLYLLVVK